MGKKKKEIIRIIRKDFNKEDYTFVSDSILNNLNNIKDDKSTTTINKEKSLEIKMIRELRKRFIQRKKFTKAERL
jgi:hypothetical protein